MTVQRNPNILFGLGEISAHLGISEGTLADLVKRFGDKFPIKRLDGRVEGRSTFTAHKVALDRWWEWYCSESTRHPEARRLRPTEPPDVAAIVAREVELETREAKARPPKPAAPETPPPPAPARAAEDAA